MRSVCVIEKNTANELGRLRLEESFLPNKGNKYGDKGGTQRK